MIEPFVCAIWGKTNTWKTSFALTFPKPLVIYDFDLGAQRATPRFQEEVDTGLIDVRVYRYPLQFHIPKIVDVRELWEEWLKDYVGVLKDEKVKTVVIDTSTQLYLITRHSFLQLIQEGQPSKQALRIRLGPFEYAEPYSRLDMVTYAARSFQKYLVLVHNARNVYEEKFTERGKQSVSTGQQELDGYRRTGEMADVIMAITRVAGEPAKGLITKGALSPSMEGLTIDSPTFDKLVETAEKARLIPL